MLEEVPRCYPRNKGFHPAIARNCGIGTTHGYVNPLKSLDSLLVAAYFAGLDAGVD